MEATFLIFVPFSVKKMFSCLIIGKYIFFRCGRATFFVAEGKLEFLSDTKTLLIKTLPVTLINATFHKYSY
jgi:hypothetical protein